MTHIMHQSGASPRVTRVALRFYYFLNILNKKRKHTGMTK
jgi:hypothetical protein